MELPQSRSFAATQGGKATHDFLSLYTHSSHQQDPKPSHGDYLKTQNFLQPLEGEEKNETKEDNSVDINAKRSSVAPSSSAVEHQLPGGFGTYTITNLPSFTPKTLKTEDNVLPVASVTSNDRNDDNSNCSSYTGSGFTLWDESAARKGHVGKENSGDVNAVKEPMARVGQWPLDWPSQSSSNLRSSVSPLSSSQAPGQKNQSFMEMLKSGKGPRSAEDEDEEDLSVKKESSSSQRGELRVKVDGKSTDQKANTPRSKHSATEQRRRCKINDRFQMLRELIPHSDQKRDKASFLLEVIEYIQFLQEKVTKYEGPYPGWNGEPAKLIPLTNSHGPPDNFANQHRVANGIANPLSVFTAKLEEKAASVPFNIPRNAQVQAECSNSISFQGVNQNSIMANKTGSISPPLQLDVYAPIRSSCAVTRPPTGIPSDAGNGSLSQLQLWQSRTSDCQPVAAASKLKEQELSLEGGTINISSIYSQGLLNTLTRALQTSGVDLSQASISVQVDIGKRANDTQRGPDPTDAKNGNLPCSNQSLHRGRVDSSSYESDHTIKRLKTG